jgi:hypothetical protein
MGNKSNHAICELYGEVCDLFRQFREISEERAAHEGDPRYRNYLLQEQEHIRSRIMKRFGVLGKHFPDVSPELGKLISPEQISSSEFRAKHLCLEDTLEIFLRATQGRAMVREFESFITDVDLHEFPTTEDAIDSAVKAHPERFAELHEQGEKFYVLKGFAAQQRVGS